MLVDRDRLAGGLQACEFDRQRCATRAGCDKEVPDALLSACLDDDSRPQSVEVSGGFGRFSGQGKVSVVGVSALAGVNSEAGLF